MQTKELSEIKDKIINTTAKFTASANGWHSVNTIKVLTKELIATLSQILKIDQKD
jgi:hypothetical protein